MGCNIPTAGGLFQTPQRESSPKNMAGIVIVSVPSVSFITVADVKEKSRGSGLFSETEHMD